MSHELEQRIKCPYCDCEFSDSWEYNDYDSLETECVECDKKFILTVDFEVTYSTYKINCEDLDPPIPHEYDEPLHMDIGQDTCDRWNRENFCRRSDYTPYRYWTRKCINCEDEEYVEVEPDGKCPWIY